MIYSIKKLIPRVTVDFEKIRLLLKQKKTIIVPMVTYVDTKPVKNETMFIRDHYFEVWQEMDKLQLTRQSCSEVSNGVKSVKSSAK